MNDQGIRDLLKRYTEGLCTQIEKEWVEQWYLRESASSQNDDILPAAKLDEIRKESWREIRKRNKSWLPVRAWAASAAAILFVVLAGAFFYKFVQNNDVNEPEFIQLSTGVGEVREFILPDSSHIWLNSGSRIRYRGQFNVADRDLLLDEGEVFFDVRHLPEKPFRVQSGNTSTVVLGTAFNIRAYHYLQERQVSVIRGKVRVDSRDGAADANSAFLLPGEQVAIDTSTGGQKKYKVKADDFTSWRTGLLQFNNESLYTISKMIEDKFNVTSRFESDSIGKLRFKAGFKASDPLETILEDISQAGNLDYKVIKNEIIFSQKK